jgi:hypothetical protein
MVRITWDSFYDKIYKALQVSISCSDLHFIFLVEMGFFRKKRFFPDFFGKIYLQAPKCKKFLPYKILEIKIYNFCEDHFLPRRQKTGGVKRDLSGKI